MKKFNLIFALIVCGSLSLPLSAQVGKKGAVKSAPATTTTTPKKTTTTKKSAPARRVVHTGTPSSKTAPASNDAANERTFWESIRTSSDAEDFREYLRQYPQGQFAGLARNRLRQLETKPATTSSAPTSVASTSTTRRAGSIVRNQLGMELVYIPAGTFMMGSPATEDGRKDQEGPQHQVTIREGFYMGRYEVTQAQWQAVMGSNPSRFRGCDQCPVDNVSWEDAQEFLRKLSALGDGYSYRLPTEAEWEYACRAGTNNKFPHGNSLSSEQANFDGNYPYGGAAKGIYREKPTPVGRFQPNAWGLYDMQGNVWEWCEDFYHGNYNGAPVDGSAWLGGQGGKERVIRGGSWYSYGYTLRPAYRISNPQDQQFNDNGVRVVALART